MEIQDYIRDVNDFPEPGIVFKDITPLLSNPLAFKFAAASLINMAGNLKVDKVIGIESRGFFFAPLIAAELNAGFVPVRKPGKLPFITIEQKYSLEYGTDAVEIHEDAIKPGEKVLIHDDVLATGGTAEAVSHLVKKMGGEIVQFNFLIELDFLKGREKLSGYTITSLLNY